MLTRAIAGITVDGFCSQSGVVMPNLARKPVSGDNSGLSSHSQMADTAMLDVTTGAKKKVR